MGQIIGPSDLLKPKQPLIFVSGTFRGAEPWVEDAQSVLECRWNVFPTAFNDFRETATLHKRFKKKIDWGDHHLRQALQYGVVMFWFAKQTARVMPNQNGLHFDRSYDGNAMYDLSRSLMFKEVNPETLIVVGCDNDFDRKVALKDRVRLSRTGVKVCVGQLADTLAEVKAMVVREAPQLIV